MVKLELNSRIDMMTSEAWKYLQEENVIACPTPWSEKQLFRIYKKEKGNKVLKVYARHIYFDLRHEVIIDRRPTKKNGEDALAIILQGTKFTAHSNILIKETAYYIRKNVLSAISGEDENSFLNKWGGEILPDNYDLYVYDRIGEDRGVCASFGHNLKEIKETIDSDNVITRIIPVGFNNLMLDGATPWVESKNISAYPMVKSKFVEYSNIKVKQSDSDTEGYNTKQEAQEALKQAAEADFTCGADEPTVHYIVNMVSLENTTEYKRYKMLERVLLGDTIYCKNSKIDIETKARCISIEWDCVRRKNRKLELGNYVSTYFDEQQKVNRKIDKDVGNTYTKEQVNKMLNDYLEDVNGKKYVTPAVLSHVLIDYVKSIEITEMLLDYVKLSELTEVLLNYVRQTEYEEEITKIKERLNLLDGGE